MSYSFSVRAASREDAIKQVAEKLAEVVAQQPVHQKDAGNATDAACDFIMLAAEPDATHDIYVAVNGSIWQTEAGVQQVSVSVGVSTVDKA